MEQQFKNIFELGELKIPNYQRAYAWGEDQLKTFIEDIILFTSNKKPYYFGHFIYEKIGNTCEIIDGQQRLTTFIIYLIVCDLFKPGDDYEKYISKFSTVDFDTDIFNKLKSSITLEIDDWNFENLINNSEISITNSSKNILFALNYFRKAFHTKSFTNILDISKIEDYKNTILKAHSSIYETKGKDVAVQIFEMHNTRGLRLTTIEKVKAKLMSAIYHNSNDIDDDINVQKIQNIFAKIFHIEELTAQKSFRGNLQLDELLLSHLRVINDGLNKELDSQILNEPSRHGERESKILNYLDLNIAEKEGLVCIQYIINLSEEFLKSVNILCIDLIELDNNGITEIGDTLILEKDISCEFYLILFRIINKEKINSELIKKWEKLLFTRDFHDRYYKQLYRDNFQEFFKGIILKPSDLNTFLDEFLEKGFRPDRMENNNLQLTVKKYLEDNKENILNNGFHFWKNKTSYILYKYEKSINVNLEELRLIIKKGISIEHILPQNWYWINEHENNLSEQGELFNNKIDRIINGIGNLLIVTPSENSSESDNHPKIKNYECCSNGTYTIHNLSKEKWNDCQNWENLILNRGNEIYNFLINGFLEFK